MLSAKIELIDIASQTNLHALKDPGINMHKMRMIQN
jgi:hypothetical protein